MTIRNFRYNEYESFNSSMGDAILDAAVTWIRAECIPSDIFDESDLFDWAQTNGNPADVFSDDVLAEWAEENGFIKESL